MKENYIEKKFVKKIKGEGGIALKFISPSMSGLPDRLVLLPGGKAVFVELKAPGRKPSPKQEKVHMLLRNMGFTVDIIDSIEGVKDFIGVSNGNSKNN